VAYSPDSQLLATGADDNKVKVNLMCETLVLSFFQANGYVVYIKILAQMH
jgi:hypothetical protein